MVDEVNLMVTVFVFEDGFPAVRDVGDGVEDVLGHFLLERVRLAVCGAAWRWG